MDYCSYQLVDKNSHNVVKNYWNNLCTSGYNQCAVDRDRKNQREWSNRYFCAETFRDEGYANNEDNYNDDDYYDDNDYEDDYYDDDDYYDE